MYMSHQSRYITHINLGKGCAGDSTSHFHQLASGIDWLLVSKTSYIHVGICQSSRIRNQGWRRVTPNLFVLRIDPSTTVDSPGPYWGFQPEMMLMRWNSPKHRDVELWLKPSRNKIYAKWKWLPSMTPDSEELLIVLLRRSSGYLRFLVRLPTWGCMGTIISGLYNHSNFWRLSP